MEQSFLKKEPCICCASKTYKNLTCGKCTDASHSPCNKFIRGKIICYNCLLLYHELIYRNGLPFTEELVPIKYLKISESHCSDDNEHQEDHKNVILNMPKFENLSEYNKKYALKTKPLNCCGYCGCSSSYILKY